MARTGRQRMRTARSLSDYSPATCCLPPGENHQHHPSSVPLGRDANYRRYNCMSALLWPHRTILWPLAIYTRQATARTKHLPARTRRAATRKHSSARISRYSHVTVLCLGACYLHHSLLWRATPVTGLRRDGMRAYSRAFVIAIPAFELKPANNDKRRCTCLDVARRSRTLNTRLRLPHSRSSAARAAAPRRASGSVSYFTLPPVPLLAARAAAHAAIGRCCCRSPRARFDYTARRYRRRHLAYRCLRFLHTILTLRTARLLPHHPRAAPYYACPCRMHNLAPHRRLHLQRTGRAAGGRDGQAGRIASLQHSWWRRRATGDSWAGRRTFVCAGVYSMACVISAARPHAMLSRTTCYCGSYATHLYAICGHSASRFSSLAPALLFNAIKRVHSILSAEGHM